MTLIWLTILSVVVVDFLSKGLIRQGTFGNVKLITNSGLAFSIPSANWISALITAVILAVLFFYFLRHKNELENFSLFGFGLILGGALSNLLERIYTGGVTDFIHIGNTVVNMADLAIITGLITLIISEVKNKLTHSSPKLSS